MRPMILAFLIAFAAASAGAGAVSDAGLERARAQVRAHHLRNVPAAAGIRALVGALKPDGSWPDVNYQCRQRGAWRTAAHSGRVYELVRALAATNSPLHDDPAVAAAFHRALGWWMKNDFTCPNWWYNDIGVPMQLGPAALVAEPLLTPEEKRFVTDVILSRSAKKMTGQNRVWLAGNMIVRGLLLDDAKMVADHARAIFEEVVVTTGEGIQPDYSFHQHGAQLQFGNYGLAFAGDILEWWHMLEGTPFAPEAAKLDVMRRYYLLGQNWVTWNGVMDFSSCGRQVSVGDPESKGRSIQSKFRLFAELDPACAAHYAAFNARNAPRGTNELVGSRHFWRSDYLVYRRPGFYASVKMCSTRVIGAESLNDENLSGYYTADGATLLYRTGAEYRDLQPAWDWRRLPGVTCPQSDAPVPPFRSYRGGGTFVGGVADNQGALAAMEYVRDGVRARKAWFCSGDAVACLGAGIESTQGLSIATSVNQCRRRGPIRLRAGGAESEFKDATRTFSSLEWVEHDGFRYAFPATARITLAARQQKGSWRRIENKANVPAEDVTAEVFSLAFEHGTQPAAATYAWNVRPVAAPAAAEPAVIVNTPALQAVRFEATRVTQAVFAEPGTLAYAPGRFMSVDQPCLALLDESGPSPRLSLADPTQQLAALSGKLNGTPFRTVLPRGGEAGRTVTAEVKP